MGNFWPVLLCRGITACVYRVNPVDSCSLWLVFTSVLCLAIVVLVHVLNSRQHRRRTGANHDLISSSTDYLGVTTYTRMTITVNKIARVTAPLNCIIRKIFVHLDYFTVVGAILKTMLDNSDAL